MPQDFDKYFSDKVANSESTILKDKYSDMLPEADRPSINAPASSGTEPKKYKSSWDGYVAKNKNLENNLSIMFSEEKTPDGNHVISWTSRIKKLANYDYAEAIDGLYAKTGKTATTKAWGQVHKDAKELLSLMTRFDLEENEKGELNIKPLDKTFDRKALERVNALLGSIQSGWNTATRALEWYKTKDGGEKRKSASDIHYIYDEIRDQILPIEEYHKLNFDIKPGKDFAANITDVDDPLAGWNKWLKQRAYLPDEITTGAKDILTKWSANTINNIGDEGKKYFDSSSKWAKNRGFADQLVRDLFELGSEKGIGNFTADNIKAFQKGYEASAGGTKDNPYDIRKQYKWIQSHDKKIQEMLSALTPRQAMQLYQRYDTLGVGKDTRPGVAENFTSKSHAKEYDRFQNSYDNFMKDAWELKHTFNDLSAQAVREMDESIEAESPLLVTIPSEASNITQFNLFSEKVPEIMKHLIYNFAVDGANNIRTKDEIWKLVQTGSKDELFDEYIDRKIAAVNSSAKTPSWKSKTEEERSELRSQWASQFENLFYYVDYFRGSQKDASFAANLYKSLDSYGKDFNSEYDKFYDNYRKKFSALEPQHIYPAASMMGGYKHQGNYSLVVDYVDFGEYDDPVQNEKNQNFLHVIDGAIQGLDLDLSEDVFQGEKGSSKDMGQISYRGGGKPNVFVSYGDINFDLDLTDTGQLNGLEGPNGGYTYAEQKKILDTILSKKGQQGYEIEYYNSTKNRNYKAYTLRKKNPTKSEKEKGTDMITIYMSNEQAKSSGEKLAINEYSDQADFIFDAKGSYSIRELQSIAGVSKAQGGKPRIKQLEIVNIQGAKYAQYRELDWQTGQYSLQKTYLGPTDKLGIGNAMQRVQQLLESYKLSNDQLEKDNATEIERIIAQNVM